MKESNRDELERRHDDAPTDSLLRRRLEGDHEALDVLFARYLDRARRIVRGEFPRLDDAMLEDIVQEGLTRAFARLDNYRGEDQFRGWMRTLLVNTAKSVLKRNGRHAAASLDDESSSAPSEPVSDATSPSGAAHRRESAQELERALSRLAPRSESVVRGRQRGEPFATIADRLGISEENCRQIHLRALRQLSEFLGEGPESAT